MKNSTIGTFRKDEIDTTKGKRSFFPFAILGKKKSPSPFTVHSGLQIHLDLIKSNFEL